MIPRLRELRDRAERALDVMLEQPIYIVFSADLPGRQKLLHSSAMTSKWLTAEMKPFLQDRWRGWGPSMLINEQELVRFARESARVLPWTSSRTIVTQEFVDAVAHETGHILQYGWNREPYPLPMPEWVDEISFEVTATLRAAEPVPLQGLSIPWSEHDGIWIRLYLHASHRLQGALAIQSEPTFDTKAIGLSPRWKYSARLGDEPTRLERLPLTKIVDVIPPEAFVAAWRDDVQRWWLGLSAPTTRQTDLLLHGLDLFKKR